MVLTIMEAKGKDAWGLLLVLLLGQLVAFSMAVSSFTSSLIATLGTHSNHSLILVNFPFNADIRARTKIDSFW
jgi:solute carrier family 35 protein F1/2